MEGDPRPRRRWVKPSHQRTVPYQDDHIRQRVIGAVTPASGERFSLVVDSVDKSVFQFFLDEMAQAVPGKLGVRKMLILDNASWHESAPLNWHQFEPKFPSGYSPAFNPVGRLWLRLKVDWFWDYSARSPSGPLAPPLPGPQKLRQQPRQNRVQLLPPEMIFENQTRLAVARELRQRTPGMDDSIARRCRAGRGISAGAKRHGNRLLSPACGEVKRTHA